MEEASAPPSTDVAFEIRCSVRTFSMRALSWTQLDALKDRVAFGMVRLEKVISRTNRLKPFNAPLPACTTNHQSLKF